MLSECICDKIRRTIFNSLPEEIKAVEKINSLKNYICNYSMNILTPAEKEFIEKYPKNYAHQQNLNFKGDGFDFKRDDVFKYYSYYGDQIAFMVCGNISCIEFEDTPRLGDWEIIKKDFPDLYSYCETEIKEIVSLKQTVLNKMRKLEDVIKLKSLTLTNLKNYFPELYKIAKS